MATHEEKYRELTDLIEVIRPAVQADGGDIQVVSADTDTGVVTIRLEGACSSCAISTTTLEDGVSRILQDRLEWVREVVGELSVEETPVAGFGAWQPKDV